MPQYDLVLEHDGRFNDFYNDLATVEEASRQLQKRESFKPFLDDFWKLAREEGLSGRIGVFLLHKHFTVPTDYLMGERTRRLVDGEIALVTKAREALPAAAGSEYAPSRWAIVPEAKGGARYVPLEYSADDGVKKMVEVLKHAEGFLRSFAALVLEYDLADLCGLAIAGRQSLLLGVNDAYAEISDITSHESIVQRFDLADIPIHEWLPTLWVPDIGPVACWCETKTVCRSYCFKSGDQAHEQSHAKVPEHTTVPCV